MASSSPSVPIVFDDKTKKTFTTIDEEIAKYQALILDRKTQRNRIAPISTLPSEVLSHVFLLASRDTTTSTLGWIRLTYVCRDWRELALNYPFLWTRIPLEYNRWADEMLSRSKTASLTVQQKDATSQKSLYKVIVHHMSRIELLSVRVSWGVDAAELFRAIPRFAPRLETLIMNRPLPLVETTNERGSRFRITENSLCEMPRIKRLESIGIHIDWSLHLQNTITVLKLRYSLGSTKPTAAQFWDALGRMSLLETLHLLDCLPLDMKPSSSTQKINFEYLADLEICAHVEETEYLLEGIRFPATTLVSVTCRRSPSSDFTSIVSSVASRSRIKGAQNPISYLESLLDPTGESLWIRLSSSVVLQNEMSLDFTLDPSRCKIGKVLSDVFLALRPLDGVSEVRIRDFMDQISPAQILETYGSLLQLRKLTGKLGPNFILALQHTFSDLGQVRPSFPNLHHIVLEGSDFNGVNSEDPLAGDTSTTEMLLDCLMWRYEHGAEVQRLELRDCVHLLEADVDAIREIVVEVEWDGFGGFTTSEEYDSEDDDGEDAYSYDEYEDDS